MGIPELGPYPSPGTILEWLARQDDIEEIQITIRAGVTYVSVWAGPKELITQGSDRSLALAIESVAQNYNRKKARGALQGLQA